MSCRFLVLLSFVVLSVVGCATSNYSVGKDFATGNISKIVKGKTTTEELVALVGSQPFTKTVLSGTEEKWMYMYTTASSTAQNYVVTMNVKTTSYQKTLDVLITNGVVTNYTFNEGTNPGAVTVN